MNYTIINLKKSFKKIKHINKFINIIKKIKYTLKIFRKSNKNYRIQININIQPTINYSLTILHRTIIVHVVIVNVMSLREIIRIGMIIEMQNDMEN